MGLLLAGGGLLPEDPQPDVEAGKALGCIYTLFQKKQGAAEHSPCMIQNGTLSIFNDPKTQVFMDPLTPLTSRACHLYPSSEGVWGKNTNNPTAEPTD